jgi:hypothetical protein
MHIENTFTDFSESRRIARIKHLAQTMAAPCTVTRKDGTVYVIGRNDMYRDGRIKPAAIKRFRSF